MTPDDEELEELRAATETGDRLDADADADDRDDEPETFVDAILDELEAIDSGDLQKTVSVWDRRSKAYLGALEDDEERLGEVLERLRDELGYRRTSDAAKDEADKSDVIRAALRLGLSRGDPDGWDDLETAREEHDRGGP